MPNETTVCKFRHLLEDRNLGEEIPDLLSCAGEFNTIEMRQASP